MYRNTATPVVRNEDTKPMSAKITKKKIHPICPCRMDAFEFICEKISIRNGNERWLRVQDANKQHYFMRIDFFGN